MENLFITIVCVALILLGTVSYATSSLSAVDVVAGSLKETTEQAMEIGRTDITATEATTVNGTEVEVTLSNSGNTALRNFSKWDVIIRYQNGTTQWIPYSAAVPGWSINGIFLNGSPEVFEPGIFNPAETLEINVSLSPAVADNTTNLAVISTDNGVNTRITFGW